MATGDDAIAAGMDVVSGTADRRQGYDEINKTRDYIAQRTSTVQPVSKGGTGATNAATARTNLGAAAADHNHDGRYIAHGGSDAGDLAIAHGGGRAQLFAGGNFKGLIAYTSDIPAPVDVSGKRNYDDGYFPGDLNAKNLYVRESFGASSGWTVAYINTDGRLSKGTSSLRYKDLLADPDVSTLGNIWPTLRQYAIKNGDGKPTLGWIAEEVAANPDTERFAVYQWAEQDGEWGPTDTVDSIDFIQLLIAQTMQLNARVTALETAQQPTPAPETEAPS